MPVFYFPISVIKTKNTKFDFTQDKLRDHKDHVFDESVDPFAYVVAWIAEPKRLNARLDRQAGSFLVSGDRGTKIQVVLDSQTYTGVKMIKFHVDHRLYASLFALLRKMNINSKSLYGDLGGLARSIKMQMQVYSIPAS